jgi:hypothetical protein
VLRSTKNTNTAPNPKKKASATRATGKLKVISGIRPACVILSIGSAKEVLLAVRSVLHTGQRTALTLIRVPQVGHIFPGEVGRSELIKYSLVL